MNQLRSYTSTTLEAGQIKIFDNVKKIIVIKLYNIILHKIF